ncbi:MAG: hypothetical protein GXX85_06775 [Ignavibacteria bacterium]|nr:hypothetical protein [Ignavibacteria bacterium]
MMEKINIYTYLYSIKNEYKLLQVKSTDVFNSKKSFLELFLNMYINNEERSINKFLKDFEDEQPTLINGTNYTWCMGVFWKQEFVLFNIVETREIFEPNNEYTFVMHYEGGTFISQFNFKETSINAIINEWVDNYNFVSINKEKVNNSIKSQQPIKHNILENIWEVIDKDCSLNITIIKNNV